MQVLLDSYFKVCVDPLGHWRYTSLPKGGAVRSFFGNPNEGRDIQCPGYWFEPQLAPVDFILKSSKISLIKLTMQLQFV